MTDGTQVATPSLSTRIPTLFTTEGLITYSATLDIPASSSFACRLLEEINTLVANGTEWGWETLDDFIGSNRTVVVPSTWAEGVSYELPIMKIIWLMRRIAEHCYKASGANICQGPLFSYELLNEYALPEDICLLADYFDLDSSTPLDDMIDRIEKEFSFATVLSFQLVVAHKKRGRDMFAPIGSMAHGRPAIIFISTCR